MRTRLALIAIAFAVLAFAGFRGDDSRALEPRHADTACELAAQPDTDIDPPAIVRAAVATPAAPQTHLDIEPGRRAARPPLDAAAAALHVPADPSYDLSRPRTFPLLI